MHIFFGGSKLKSGSAHRERFGRARGRAARQDSSQGKIMCRGLGRELFQAEGKGNHICLIKK